MSIKNDGFLVKGEAIESDDEEVLNGILEKPSDNIRVRYFSIFTWKK